MSKKTNATRTTYSTVLDANETLNKLITEIMVSGADAEMLNDLREARESIRAALRKHEDALCSAA